MEDPKQSYTYLKLREDIAIKIATALASKSNDLFDAHWIVARGVQTADKLLEQLYPDGKLPMPPDMPRAGIPK